VQVVDVRDLGAFLVRLVEANANGTYNATGPAARLTTRELLTACMPPDGGAALFWIPQAFLAAQGVSPWTDLPAWVPARGEHPGLAQIANARALAAGLAFRPLAETARDTLAWWRTLPEDRRARLKAGLSPEREALVLSAWKARAG
jgi:2'-hydroxyisoflavone reductase